ncbi:hypothetical protein SAMN05444358_101523 [Ruegeria halocynthiae]|uniref:Lipoprotein-attachment site-containing protein n=1 Tax=Ruegeria halocynthiae TaxID=985054 RepID=A0A1H2SMW1_9RHOB|nr:hypothetical protein [Ruegeria halocynthiae]SDW32971.1 hypothetical protein SAMN05444358_101523 [Ruegeria halocynthiae]
MSASKVFLVISMLSVGVLTACSEPGTYPITGMEVSQDDPVKKMNNPDSFLRGEAR